jgi:hypothetical protein
MRHIPLLYSTLALAALGGAASLPPDENEFEELALTLDVNLTDGDNEVILHAETGQPIERIVVIAPDGRVVYRVDTTSPTGLGLSELRIGVGELGFVALTAAFPEGLYTVRARALDGSLLVGLAALSHELPQRWRVALPTAQGGILDRASFLVAWEEVPGVERTTLEVVDEENDVTRLQVTPMPGDSRFTVPFELLEPDHPYQLRASAYGANGNRLIQERSIRTAR